MCNRLLPNCFNYKEEGKIIIFLSRLPLLLLLLKLRITSCVISPLFAEALCLLHIFHFTGEVFAGFSIHHVTDDVLLSNPAGLEFGIIFTKWVESDSMELHSVRCLLDLEHFALNIQNK